MYVPNFGDAHSQHDLAPLPIRDHLRACRNQASSTDPISLNMFGVRNRYGYNEKYRVANNERVALTVGEKERRNAPGEAIAKARALFVRKDPSSLWDLEFCILKKLTILLVRLNARV